MNPVATYRGTNKPKKMYFEQVCAAPVVLLFILDSPVVENHLRVLRPGNEVISIARDLNMIGHFAGQGQEFSLYWCDRVFPIWYVLKPSFSYSMIAALLERTPGSFVLKYPYPILEDALSLPGKSCYALAGVSVSDCNHNDPSFALSFGAEATAISIEQYFDLEKGTVVGNDIIVRRDHLFARLKVIAPELVEGLPKMHASFWFPHYFYLRGMLSPPQPLKQVPLPLTTKKETKKIFSRAGWEIVPQV